MGMDSRQGSGFNLADQPVRAVPKKVEHKRGSKTARQRGNISAKVAADVDERSMNSCERCKWKPGLYDPTGHKWGLQRAHLRRRWKQDETTAEEVAKLCGPSINTKTCHHWIDHTEAGRKWAIRYREQLIRDSKLEREGRGADERSK